MSIHRIWVWIKDGVCFTEADDLPGEVVEVPTMEGAEEAIRKRLREALGDPTPKLDVRYTTLHKRRADRFRAKGPVLDRGTIRSLIDSFDLTQYHDEILVGSKPAVQILTKQLRAGEIPVLGGSRFCGPPDLPAEAPWPTSEGRPLTMLAQLRLSELPGFPPEETADLALPRTGLLWFWYDTFECPWDSKRGDPDAGIRVTHVPDESVSLVRRELPREVAENSNEWSRPCALGFRRVVSLPWLEDTAMKMDELDRYFELRDMVEASKGVITHHLRGNQAVDGESVLEDHPDAKILASFASDESGPKWSWGDAGDLHFWIGSEDLRRGRLSAAWGAIETG